MPVHPLPARIAELQPRKVVTFAALPGGGFDALLECGHHAYLDHAPPQQLSCERCADQVVERLRKRRVVE